MSNFRITPIGTCRIHTPLRRATMRYPVEAEARRNYGFVHTSEEALQLLQFLQGDRQLPAEIAPLIARDGDLARYEAEEWLPSDLHLIEISSSKRITCNGTAVQSNYLYHHFADFFANSERARRYWDLVKQTHRRHLIFWLRHEPAFKLLSIEDRELLSNLQIEQQSFKTIKNDMAEIVERLGADKVLFVTHVNATTPDDELISTRDRLIRWVKMAAEQLGAPVFDPTPAMQEFGQEKALEKGGLDLTHYTPAFYDHIYDEMHRVHISGVMGATGEDYRLDPAQQQVANLAARLEAMLETGDFFVASKEVHEAVARMPRALPLIELRGAIRSRIGDYPGAVEDLSNRGDDSALSQSMRVGLVEAYNATGEADGALRVAENLLAEEYESAVMYRAAAEAAERLGRFGDAMAYAKQSFRMDHDDLSAALRALKLLTEHGSVEETAAWRSELLENIGPSASGAFEVGIWALHHRDEELFAAAVKAVAGFDKGGTVDLFEDAFNADMHRAVARTIRVAVELGRLPRSLSERRLSVIEGALAKARLLFDEAQSVEAHELAHAISELAGINSSQVPTRKLAGEARKLAGATLKNVRESIRNAYKDQDLAEVLRIGEAAGELLVAMPDGAAVYARSLHAMDRTEEALAVMKQALTRDGDDFVALRWTGRFAAIAGDYITALEAYGKLRRSQDPQLRTVAVELDRFYAGVEGRALKELRRLVVEGEFRSALRLAQLMKEEVGAEERVDRELHRMHGMLRRRLKELDQSEGQSDEREVILRRIVDVRPEDPIALRRLAVELMRRFRFAEAAEIWQRITDIEPTNEAAAKQRERCTKMARRRVAAWTGELDDAA